jgi:hypothetical protein
MRVTALKGLQFLRKTSDCLAGPESDFRAMAWFRGCERTDISFLMVYVERRLMTRMGRGGNRDKRCRSREKCGREPKRKVNN